MKQIFTQIMALLCLSVYFNNAQAQLIFQESFSYPTGNLEGSNGGTGFTTSWSQTGTDAMANLAATTTAQITSGSINSTFGTGNKLQICLQTGRSSRFDRSLGTTYLGDAADGGTFWLGFWYNCTTADATTYGLAAQLILMNTANSSVATDQRLGFGKTSNFTTVGNQANVITGFTRSSSNNCAAQNWPIDVPAATNLGLPTSAGTYYILVKIVKKEFNLSVGAGFEDFDGIRVWILSAPPTGTTDAVFTTKPNGDIYTLDASMNQVPIQTRLLRLAGNTGNIGPAPGNVSCRKDGITGIRIRVEGTSATPFCAEFDELRLASSLESILAVSFGDVYAKVIGRSNVLYWNTLTEINNKGFYIEHSTDLTNWKTLGFVQGAGNSTLSNNYTFTDNNPTKNGYYRIRQESTSGNKTYSNAVKVFNDQNSFLQIAPNPVQDVIKINLSKFGSNNIVSVQSVSGSTVIRKTFSGSTTTIDASTLPKGVYIVTINTDGEISTAKLIKN